MLFSCPMELRWDVQAIMLLKASHESIHRPKSRTVIVKRRGCLGRERKYNIPSTWWCFNPTRCECEAVIINGIWLSKQQLDSCQQWLFVKPLVSHYIIYCWYSAPGLEYKAPVFCITTWRRHWEYILTLHYSSMTGIGTPVEFLLIKQQWKAQKMFGRLRGQS